MATGDKLKAVKTADESVTNDTTVTLDTDLQVTVASSTTYILEAVFVSPQPNPLRFNWQAPAGLTREHYVYYQEEFDTIDTGTNGIFVREGTAIPLSTQSTGTTTNFYQMHRITGLFTTGTGGAFGLRWAQTTNNATATTLNQGSWFILTEL